MNHSTRLFVLSSAFALVACSNSGTSATEASKPAGNANSASAVAKQAQSQGKARSYREALNTAEYTSAPVRLRAIAQLDAPPAEVWAYVSNHDNLVEYTNGALKHANIDHSGAGEKNGVGTKRHCEAPNGDKFVENIVYFRAPYVFAYQAVENSWGLSDHLAVVALEPNDNGGTTLVWEQYFNHANEPVMTANLKGLYKSMLMPFFTNKFGGSFEQS